MTAVAYAVVPRADGTPPPNWPAGFDRAALRGPIAIINALLVDHGLDQACRSPRRFSTADTRSRCTSARCVCKGRGGERGV